jgi:hypothetical protein
MASLGRVLRHVRPNEWDTETREQRKWHEKHLPVTATLDPRGATLAFVNDARGIHGDAFLASWLLSGRFGFNVCRFTEDRIYTTGIGYDRLSRTCSDLADKHRVRIYENRKVREEFRNWQPVAKTTGGKK